MPNSPFLTPAEVAVMYHVDSKTASRWIRTGKLLRVGTPSGHGRALRVEVEALLHGETPEKARKIALAARDALIEGLAA